MSLTEFKTFSESEHGVWRALYEMQSPKRVQQLHPMFIAGLDYLKITGNEIPSLAEVNERLIEKTGFSGVAVEGLENGDTFYSMLANREFPIGNFIRAIDDLSYTPAPDVFHDLYGHLPFLADEAFANYCAEFGRRAVRYRSQPELFRQFERFFWFTVEFGLIETSLGCRIYGGGIASSFAECNYALSSKPQVLAYDIDDIRFQEFSIDQIQPKLFVIKNLQQLYSTLELLEERINQNTKTEGIMKGTIQ